MATQAEQNPDRLVGIDEMAEILAISDATLYRLARERRVPCYQVGGRWRFRVSEVLEAFQRKPQ